MLAILWNSGPSKGYSDIYPDRWFNQDCEADAREHEVKGPRGGIHRSKCDVRVKGRVAELDYGGEHTSFNRSQHFIGVLRIVFADDERRNVEKVLWQDEGTTEFVEEDVEAFRLEVPLEGLEDFDPVSIEDGRQRIKRLVVLRQGQANFRSALRAAYRDQCAITGCRVPEVLEAAHIMPYLGTETNHVQNGLLLRADIHTLFDLGIIKIDRDYRIHAAPSIVEAFSLPDALMNRPEDEAMWPNPQALASKWE